MCHEIKDMEKVEITDHEFAKYLRKKDENWTYKHIGEYTQFVCNGKIAALAKYKNFPTIGRQIWIRKAF